MGISEFDFLQMQSRLNKGKGIVAKASKPVEEEQDLHDQIISLCRSRGWGYINPRSDMMSTITKGAQDFTIFADRGRVFCFECKDREGKLSIDQQAWAAQMRHNGHGERLHVVRSIEEVLDIIDQRKLPYTPPTEQQLDQWASDSERKANTQ